MIQKLFSRFYDPENADSNMKYAVLAIKNIKKRNKENIDFLNEMDSDLKNIDKISANLGPDDLGGDNPDINNIKSKYILTYSDIKKVIFKDLCGIDINNLNQLQEIY